LHLLVTAHGNARVTTAWKPSGRPWIIRMAPALRFGPLSFSAVHLCIDMQSYLRKGLTGMFRGWSAFSQLWSDWPRRVATVACSHASPRPDEAVGAWRRYYKHWRHMTGESLNPRLIELVPPLPAIASCLPRTHCAACLMNPTTDAATLRLTFQSAGRGRPRGGNSGQLACPVNEALALTADLPVALSSPTSAGAAR